jgi:hypothetical protein
MVANYAPTNLNDLTSNTSASSLYRASPKCVIQDIMGIIILSFVTLHNGSHSLTAGEERTMSIILALYQFA